MPVLDFDLKSDPPYFTMPLADRNFEDEIIAQRILHKIPVQGLSDLLNALETLHSLGYTHRDVKPQNLLLHENVWKLADFGLVTPGADITAVTSANSGWGSARYQAPEQYSGFKAVTPQADIYSFGCLLHDVLGSGVRVPYERQTCNGPVGMIIEKCTEKDPRKRFKSVTALRGALMTILANPIQIQASPDAAEWVQKLPNVGEWTDDLVLDYVHFLNQASNDDVAAIFEKVDEEWLAKAHARDQDLWHNSVMKYTEWAKGTFPFDYCDVLVRRLEKIFELGTFDCAAAATIAAAELGCSHNRWFVMKRVKSLCSPTLNEKLAERIAIEIAAEEAERNFIGSVEGIGEQVEAYHPAIASVLQAYINKQPKISEVETF